MFQIYSVRILTEKTLSFLGKCLYIFWKICYLDLIYSRYFNNISRVLTDSFKHTFVRISTKDSFHNMNIVNSKILFSCELFFFSETKFFFLNVLLFINIVGISTKNIIFIIWSFPKTIFCGTTKLSAFLDNIFFIIWLFRIEGNDLLCRFQWNYVRNIQVLQCC